jgi:hypothetical protein
VIYLFYTNKETHMTREQFYQELERHDWYYMMSDDMRVYQSGYARYNKLKAIASVSTENEKLFKDFEGYMFKKNPKPEL